MPWVSPEGVKFIMSPGEEELLWVGGEDKEIIMKKTVIRQSGSTEYLDGFIIEGVVRGDNLSFGEISGEVIHISHELSLESKSETILELNHTKVITVR